MRQHAEGMSWRDQN